MKTILFVHQSAELYGSDKMLHVLLSRLDRDSFKAVVILPSDGPLKEVLEQEGIIVVVAPVLKVYRKMFTPGNMLTFFKEIKKGIRMLDRLNEQYKFDFVYSNTLAVLLGMIYSRKRKIKHIWHVHEIIVHPKIIAAIYPHLLKWNSDVIICNSNATRHNLTGRIQELEKKCVVVYNGVDRSTGVNNDLPSISRQALGYSDNDVIVTLVGRISRLKGHKWLMRAFTEHLLQTDVKLLFVGSPVPGQEFYMEEIERIIAENKLGEKVKIIPFTKGLQSVWDVTDIAVMPSTEAESFGLVALEAMLEKKPVIASNHGGLAEIVINNQTGLLVEPNNTKELAGAILQLAGDTNLRETMAGNGYARAVAEFSEAQYVEKISALLKG